MLRVIVSWSSGKDSAWTLHLLREREDVEIVALFTTVNAAFQKVAMHGVRRDLVERQANEMGLPLWVVELPGARPNAPCSNAQYEELTRAVWQRAVEEGVHAVAFGDLFLADIRQYRERQLAGTGIEPIFPLWNIPTDELARTMVQAGMRATITCVDPHQVSPSFAGREFDESLLLDLPPGADPCGENGEFHTFVWHSPEFKKPINIELGGIVERDGFVFADLLSRAD